MLFSQGRVRAGASRRFTGAPPPSKRLGSGDEAPEAPGAGSPCFVVLSAVSVGLPGPALSEPISPERSIVPGLRPPRGPADGQYRPAPTS